jgi:NAD(P)H dehydrogenase (quinone)
MPAILKGWVERVYAYGFGYGVGEHSDRRWGDRYGEGTFVGKRAMLIVTAGGWADHYSERGVNGPIDDLLFPINHGILYYPGFDVLPPFVIYRADSIDESRYQAATRELEGRLLAIETTEPIPYRKQNAGDYVIPACTLKPGLEDEGQQGLRLHTQPRARLWERLCNSNVALEDEQNQRHVEHGHERRKESSAVRYVRKPPKTHQP